MTEDTETPANEQLAEEVAEFYSDPLGFVMFAYPWGEEGTALEGFDGPDTWQREFLTTLGELIKERGFDGAMAVMPIRMARSSGHGIGKSALVGWLVGWLMSTRPYAQGTVTANTQAQLKTKTWGQVAKWMRLCITGHWFNVNTGRGNMSIEHLVYPSEWFCTAQTCREENSEAFAGQHAVNSTSFYIFDEGSAVPDAIYEVAEGGLTDGEPMMFVFGNPTKSTGKLHRIVFGSEKHRWNSGAIDSRTCMLPNHELHEQWIDDHGIDSDFVRVRVRGLPPGASDLQFIDSNRVYDAQRRVAVPGMDDPLICGVDIARGGADNNVIRFRRGRDARTIPPIKIPGELTRDSMKMVSRIVEVIAEGWHGQIPDQVNVDGTGIGGPVVDRCRELGYNVHEVQFGGASPKKQFKNMRSFMWGEMKAWLLIGAIDEDEILEMDLVGPDYGHDAKDKIVLESKDSMKKRGLKSPDDGDALALTFATPVASRAFKLKTQENGGGGPVATGGDYDPFKEMHE